MLREAGGLCCECHMACAPGEFHPYAACLMFKQCHDSMTVRENLRILHPELLADAIRLQRERIVAAFREEASFDYNAMLAFADRLESDS